MANAKKKKILLISIYRLFVFCAKVKKKKSRKRNDKKWEVFGKAWLERIMKNDMIITIPIWRMKTP